MSSSSRDLQNDQCADAGPSPRSPLAHVHAETAVIYRGGRRRYFTRSAATREAARHVIREFKSRTGDDDIELDVYQDLVSWLMARIEAGESVTPQTVDEYFNPHHYPDDTVAGDRAASRDEGGLRDEPLNREPGHGG